MKFHNRRDFLKYAGLSFTTFLLTFCQTNKKLPNIVLILTDDLGYGDLGCYGQKKIKTPNIDILAAEGIKFRQFYSGAPVCAPARCVLMTGKHTGHSQIRNNKEIPEGNANFSGSIEQGQYPLSPGTETIGTLLQRKGYRTCCVGKWGLGSLESTGRPDKQGFHHFFGYIDQRHAHDYYRTHLWRNTPDKKDEKVEIPENKGGEHTHTVSLMIEEALDFIRNNKDNPFLLYYATPIPHVSLQVPDEFLNQYKDKFKETPYKGGHYAAHPTPRAAYAAMISYMDHNVGRLVDLLEKLDIKDNTLILFTSDNGPTFGFGVDYEFFKSNGPLRGLKQDLLEGGIRVPMIASWKDIIKEGSSSDHICAFWDILPTISEIVNEPIKSKVDGLSILPSLLGKSQKQEKHEYLYWESNSQGGRQAVRMGKYKAHRRKLKENINAPVMLYDLEKDLQETTDISSKYPNIVERMKHIMQNTRKHSEVFPLFEYNK